MPDIHLKKNSDRRVRSGHLWVFSNEIADPPVADLEPGGIYDLRDHAREFLGVAYANPGALISARILSRKKAHIDGAFLRERIVQADDRRRFLRDRGDAYRVVYGESDFLPGLVVDRYGDYLAVQLLTAGTDQLREEVIEVLTDIFSPAGIYLRNDSPARALEGLPQVKELAYGEVPERVEIRSAGLRFLVDIVNGQKTGFFIDQESNRALVREVVPEGAQALDLFSYSGAWGLHALHGGADTVTAVDSSRGALALAEENAHLNDMGDRFRTVRSSAVDFLKKTGPEWDLIVVDPPAFIKSRSGVKEGRKGYIDVNRRALGRLTPGGIIITCSCSHHLDQSDFEAVLRSAARQSGRELQILAVAGQGPDHPIMLTMPETRYLNAIVARTL